MVSSNPSDPVSPARSGRRGWLIAAVASVLVLLLGGGYTVFWFQVGKQVIAGIEDWTTERRAEGWFVVYDSLSVGGFPFQFRVRLDNPVVGRPAAQTWSWRADALDVAAPPWATERLRYTAIDSTFTYNLRGLSRDILLSSPRVSGDVTLRHGVIDGLTAAAEKPLLDLINLPAPITANQFDLALRRPAEAGVALDGSFAATALDGPLEGLDKLGGTIDRLAADIQITGPIPMDGKLKQRVTAWRDGGGTIEAKKIHLAWGPLVAGGDGTLTLDEMMRPLGAFSISLRGLSDFIDQLVKAGLVNNRAASGIKISVGLLAGRNAAGGVILPLNAQFGKLSIGPVVVADLPPLQLD